MVPLLRLFLLLYAQQVYGKCVSDFLRTKKSPGPENPTRSRNSPTLPKKLRTEKIGTITGDDTMRLLAASGSDGEGEECSCPGSSIDGEDQRTCWQVKRAPRNYSIFPIQAKIRERNPRPRLRSTFPFETPGAKNSENRRF